MSFVLYLYLYFILLFYFKFRMCEVNFMKLRIEKGFFKDKNNLKEVAYDKILSQVNINGLIYDINVRFSTKQLKDFVIQFIDNADLTTEIVSYNNKNNELVSYINPIVKLVIGDKCSCIPVILDKAEVYLIDLYNSLLNKNK